MSVTIETPPRRKGSPAARTVTASPHVHTSLLRGSSGQVERPLQQRSTRITRVLAAAAKPHRPSAAAATSNEHRPCLRANTSARGTPNRLRGLLLAMARPLPSQSAPASAASRMVEPGKSAIVRALSKRLTCAHRICTPSKKGSLLDKSHKNPGPPLAGPDRGWSQFVFYF